MRVAIVAGESSGDQLAAGLMRALRERVPGVSFEAVAGPKMREQGCDLIADADELAVMGIAEVLPEVRRLWKLRRSLIKHWRANPPDVFIGVDAPDFNLGLEKALKKAGVPTVHYVSPTVWAWREGRVHRIAEAANLVLCLFPFEPQCYREVTVDARFVGHPFAQAMRELPMAMEAREKLGCPRTGPLVALVPGSRRGEVGMVGPAMLSAAAKLQQALPQLRFVLPAASAERRVQLEELLRSHPALKVQMIDGDMRMALRAADAAWVTSGTATLEALLAGTPMAVVYRASALTNFLLRKLGLLKSRFVSLPNVLAARAVVPEFLQEQAEVSALVRAMQLLLTNAGARQAQLEAFAESAAQLDQPTDQRAADAVLELVQG